MTNKTPLVITISRQLGAGGAYIGQQLAKKLNMHYADREIIRKAAELLSVREEDLENRDEKTQAFWETLLMSSGYAPEFYVPISIKYLPSDDEMYAAESTVIRKIAERRGSVIIGRGGFYILKDRPNCLRIYLFASQKYRMSRIMESYNMNETEAAKAIEKSDLEREKFIKAFTGVEWKDAGNYDLTIDTGKLGLDKTVEAILAVVHQM